MKLPLKRNRQPRPAWSFSGLDLAGWQADTTRVTWAQVSPDFNALLTVLVNERTRALASIAGGTENMQLGLVRGYEIALTVLRDLARGTEPPRAPEPAATYELDTDLAPPVVTD